MSRSNNYNFRHIASADPSKTQQERVNKIFEVLSYFYEDWYLPDLRPTNIAMLVEENRGDELEKHIVHGEWIARQYVQLIHRQNKYIADEIYKRLHWLDKKLFRLLLKLQVQDDRFIRVYLLKWYFEGRVILYPFTKEGVTFPGLNVEKISIYDNLPEEVNVPFFGGLPHPTFGTHWTGEQFEYYISESDKNMLRENIKATDPEATRAAQIREFDESYRREYVNRK